MVLSLVSLLLALVNNLDDGSPGNPLGVPVQVDTSVRIAQYFGERWQCCMHATTSSVGEFNSLFDLNRCPSNACVSPCD